MKIDPRLLQRLQGIELKSRFLVRGMYHNRHRTSDFGSSNEFIEHRDYRRGDEIRTIDWRLFARTDRLYVKRYEMESNMKVHFLLDTSDSMRVPPSDGLPSKLDLASVIVGAVATMVVYQQDAAGLHCIGDRVEERIPPKQGVLHLSQIYQHLEKPKGKGGGNFGELVAYTARQLGSRSVVVVVSDALDDLDVLLGAMKGLCVRTQDVILFQVLDRDELTFPFDKMTEFRHPESGRKLVGDPQTLRARYLNRLQGHLDRIEDFCKKSRVDYIRVHTADDLIKLLTSHFLRRLLLKGSRC
ncbi:MAG TPA: DUF58 domain-containing protein [Planctomycetota bacterium]|nr:DUF58 domain-containing protein [Planctomycetota bacterium]